LHYFFIFQPSETQAPSRLRTEESNEEKETQARELLLSAAIKGWLRKLVENEDQARHQYQQILVSLGRTEVPVGWNSEELQSNPMDRQTSTGDRMYTSVQQLHGICAENDLEAEAFEIAVKKYDTAKNLLLGQGYDVAMVRSGLTTYLLGGSDGNIITL